MTKVKCSACGKMKFVNPQALTARIAKYGSVEEIEKKWKCSICAKSDKAEPVKKAEIKISKKETVKVAPKTVEEYEEPTISVEEEGEIEEMLAKQ